MAVRKRKRCYKGKLTESACYYGTFRGADGVEHTVKLCEDKGASETILSEHRKRAVLEAIGVVNPFEEHMRRPLAEHLADYEADLKARGRTEKHTRLIVTHCKALLKSCKCQMIAELSASRVQKALGELVETGLALQTANHYFAGTKSFARWLVADRRMADNPLAGVRPFNARTDRRRVRRALTADEVRTLLAATRAASPAFAMTGEHRALLYATALGTGLRAGELASLTWASFDLGDKPSVTVGASYSKHRREDTLPLPEDLAHELHGWARTHSGDAKAFPYPTSQRKCYGPTSWLLAYPTRTRRAWLTFTLCGTPTSRCWSRAA